MRTVQTVQCKLMVELEAETFHAVWNDHAVVRFVTGDWSLERLKRAGALA